MEGPWLTSSPQSSSRTGCFSFFFLFTVEEALSSSTLFLDGDFFTPLSTTPMTSCILLSCTRCVSQFLTVLSSSSLSSKIPVVLHFSSSLSSPKVSLEILLLLNSDLELRMMSSPPFWIRTASDICLFSAVEEYLMGLRWNFGSPWPPWWIWWCFRMCESSCFPLKSLQCSTPRSYRLLELSPM